MHALVDIKEYSENKNGTDLVISVKDMRLGDMLRRKQIHNAEIRFDDGRHISAEQRKKAYATIRDIADYTGYYPEDMKQELKFQHMIRTGDADFSLSNCSMDTAREFINTILEIAIENGVPLSERGIERTDDIGRYLYCCLIHKKCAICGRDGEIHHEDAIGMGNNRRTIDDSDYRKICLCREHHTMAHQLGIIRFCQMHKVYGIIVRDFG
ncbi:MAG: putative HNHc nuclease [Roseburia sp.]